MSFSTPAAKKASERQPTSSRKTSNGLDESGLEPLEDSITEETDANRGKKRGQEQMFGSLSDSEDDDALLQSPDIGKATI